MKLKTAIMEFSEKLAETSTVKTDLLVNLPHKDFDCLNFICVSKSERYPKWQ